MPEFIPAGAVGGHQPYSLRQAGGGEGSGVHHDRVNFMMPIRIRSSLTISFPDQRDEEHSFAKVFVHEYEGNNYCAAHQTGTGEHHDQP